MNIRQIKRIVYCAVLLVLCGCSEDPEPMYGDRDRGGTPVCFTAEWPDESGMAGTRAIEDKREFTEGNVMHVSAVFQLIGKEGTPSSVTKYAALTYQNGEWVNLVTDKGYDMDWPWNAVSAEFTAYHMEEWNGPITEVGTPTDPVVLDRFEYENHIINPDPLCAKSGPVDYGHAVNLKFEHLCTRLTITDVADANEYELRFKPISGGGRILQNACTMTRKADNSLEFEFVNEESNNISSQVDVNNGKRLVTFHLAPADYSTFTLTRRNGYSYLTLSNVKELEALKDGAGKAYTVSLENLQGNIVQDDPDGDWWPPTPEPPAPDLYEDFSVQAFMNAIKACSKDYVCIEKETGKPKTLLQYDAGRKEMRLMEDVNFNRETDYEPVDLPDMVTFDGGGKTIWNISRSLFNTLQGTVTELSLQDAELIHTGEPAPGQDPTHDTGWGVLARVCDQGNISNVHLINATLDIVFHNDQNLDQVYCAGALVGNMKAGTMRRITLVNNISVTVRAFNESARYTSCVGGVVGQAIGTLEDIDHEAPEGQSLLKVTNHCKSKSTHYTGGIVGLLTEENTRLYLCDMYTVVDASGVEGTWNYTGGVAGAVRTGAVITRATVSGKVTGGKVTEGTTSYTHSSTGGIVGHLQRASVTSGIAFNRVSIGTGYNPTGDKSIYSIGGVIGSITQAEDISDNEGRNLFDAGKYTTVPSYYVGTFAGIGKKEDLNSKGNTADGTGNFVGQEN